MTQINAGVSFKGRLPQIVGQAALAASVLAGGASLLNAGGAMAADCLAATPLPPQYNQIITPVAPPSNVTGSCISLVEDEIDVLNSFSPSFPPNNSGFLTYSITASPEHWWYEVELDSQHQGTNVLVTKELFSDANLTNKIIPSLESSDGSVDVDSIPNKYSTIYVKDSYTIGAGGQLVSINNEFKQTPGPLAILGAGTAFGFSRKLRSRIKAGRTA